MSPADGYASSSGWAQTPSRVRRWFAIEDMGRPYGPGLPRLFLPSRTWGKVGGRCRRQHRTMTALTAAPATGLDGRGAARQRRVGDAAAARGVCPVCAGHRLGDRGTRFAGAGWAGSWLIFGGSAHLATIRTLDQAGPVAAILTGLLVNAAPARLQRVARAASGRASRAGSGWPGGAHHRPDVGDRAARRRSESRPPRATPVLPRGRLTLGVGWSAAIAVGAVMGTRLDWLDFQIVIPLCLLALVGPALRTGGARSVIVVAATTAVLPRIGPRGPVCSSRSSPGARPAWPATGGGNHDLARDTRGWARRHAFRVGPLLLLQRSAFSDAGDRLIRHASTAAITALIAVSTQQRAQRAGPSCRHCSPWAWRSCSPRVARR